MKAILPFAQMPPYLRLMFLILLVLASLLMVTFIGAVIGIAFFGFEILDKLGTMDSMTDMENIGMLKYFQIVSQIGTFILPAILYTLLVSRHRITYLHLEKKPCLFPSIATILIVFTALPAINWLMEINAGLYLPEQLSRLEQWMKQTEEQAAQLTELFLITSSFKALMINFLMIAILPAIGEELLFRGILIREFDNWFKNPHIAVLLSALLFSALHIQFYGFLPRFALGLIFGYLFIWSGSLWIPMLAHLVNNGTAVIVAYLVGKGMLQTDMESFGSTNNNDPLLFGSIIFTILLMIAVKTFVKRKEHVNI